MLTNNAHREEKLSLYLITLFAFPRKTDELIMHIMPDVRTSPLQTETDTYPHPPPISIPVHILILSLSPPLPFIFLNSHIIVTHPIAAYYFPNDATERERLEDQHDIFKLILDGRNFLAPLSRENPPRRILDVGTGTGTWAIDMGDDFPSAQVIGTDLSPIQPNLVPPNVQFLVDDSYVRHVILYSLFTLNPFLALPFLPFLFLYFFL